MEMLKKDQIFLILQHLPVESIIRFGMACKKFQEFAESDLVWRMVCQREWGSRAVDLWPPGSGMAWKQFYRRILFLNTAEWRHVLQHDFAPAARASHSMNSVGGSIAIFGGGCDGEPQLNRSHIHAHKRGKHLDDTWVAMAPEWTEASRIIWKRACKGIPPGRFSHSCVEIEGNLLLFGGINDAGARQNDLWITDEKMAWKLLDAENPPPERGAHAGDHMGNRKILFFGGIGSNGQRLDDTWLLDLSTPCPSWTQLKIPNSPAPRSGHTLTWIGANKLILFGGRRSKSQVLNDIWVLNLQEESAVWMNLQEDYTKIPHEFDRFDSDRPSGRAGHSATMVAGGRILIYGGEDGQRCRKGDAWLLNPNAGAKGRLWQKLKQVGDAPSSRSFHGACCVHSGGGIAVFGGMVEGQVLPAAADGLQFDAGLHLLLLMP